MVKAVCDAVQTACLWKLSFKNWFEGPAEGKKLQETCRTSMFLVSCQNDVMFPSYEPTKTDAEDENVAAASLWTHAL